MSRAIRAVVVFAIIMLTTQFAVGGRYYHAAIGRFLSVDKIADKLPAFSPYVYAINNPLAFIDPNGEFPFTFHIRSFHPDKTFGGGFSGDNRVFTTGQDVTSRIRQNFTLETDNGSISGGKPISDPSHHPILGTATATPTGNISPVDMLTSTEGSVFNFSSEYAGSNPLVMGSPDIDVNVSFSVIENRDNGTLTISFTGMGDGFPNTELFVEDANGNSIMLDTSQLTGTPFKLIGGADTKIFSGSLTIQINSDGTFFVPEKKEEEK